MENEKTKNKKDSLKEEVVDLKFQDLEKENEALRNQNKDLENKLKRALADYQNFQTRVEKQRLGYFDFVKEEVILDFLPILDNLERAVKTIEDEGLNFVIKQFNDVLKEQGLISVGKAGEVFDPNIHECVEVVKGKENEVMEVLEQGFKLREKVIKAAKVKVGKNNQK